MREIGGSALFSLPFIYGDVREAQRTGKNVAWALTKSSVQNNFLNLITIGLTRPLIWQAGIMAVQMAPAMVSLGMTMQRKASDTFRLGVQPFSQKFEHSEYSYQMQQRGLSSINGNRSSIGGEAALMHSRFARR